jgi:hypothetical protein
VSDNPYASPFAGAAGTPISDSKAQLDFASVRPLCDVAGWLKFLGIVNIIVGVIYCITIIGAIFGWLPLWIGVLLKNASNELGQGYRLRSEDGIRIGMEKLGLAIKIIGVLTVIGLAINVLYLAFVFVAILAGVASSL